MDASGIAHVAFGFSSLVLGIGNFSLSKGTDLHRLVGVSYVLSTFGLNLTSLLIYKRPGGFGVFHILAFINLAILLGGFFTVFLRRPRKQWLRYHYYLMCWSYVGLWAITVAEVMVRVVRLRLSVAMAVPTVMVMLLGGTLIWRRERQALAHLARSRTINVA